MAENQTVNVGPSPERGAPDSSVCLVVFGMLVVAASVVDLATHCYLASHLSRVYGIAAGEPLWVGIVFSSLVCLVAVVKYGSLLSLQSPSASTNQLNETTGVTMLLAAVHPEFLKYLLAAHERSHSVMIAICKLDLLRSVIEGAICPAYTLMFFIRERVTLMDRRPAPEIAVQPDANQTAALLLAFPPPSPPAPPPAPPTDLSGMTGWLLLASFIWSMVTLGLKILRYILHLEIDRRALHKQLDMNGQTVSASEEREELAYLRDLYYGDYGQQPRAGDYGQQSEARAEYYGQQAPAHADSTYNM